MFTDKEHRGPFEFSDERSSYHLGEGTNGASSHNGSVYDAPICSSSALVPIPDSQSATSTHQASLAIDDLLSLSLQSEPAPPSLKLKKAVLDPATFQQKWRRLPIFLSQELLISPQGVAALTTPQTLLQHMVAQSINCIASGRQAPNFKYFYAQKAEDTSTFLVECVINTSSCKAQIKVKADDQTSSQAFSESFQTALSSFGSL